MKYLITTLLVAMSLSFSVCAKSSCCKEKVYKKSPISSMRIADLEKYCHEEINKVRVEYGLKPLKFESELADCAREHSKDMAFGQVPFGHQGFENRAKKMKKGERGFSFGENVAYSCNYSDPIAISVEGWMDSPGHKKNILGDYESTGIGVVFNDENCCYITQLFAKRSRR